MGKQKTMDLPRHPVPEGLTCPKCGAATFKTSVQVAKNNHEHVRLDCAACGRFVQFLKQRRTRRPKHGPGPGGGGRGRGMTTFRLPFGKFKGRAIERVPVEYLSWLLAGCDLRPDIRDTIRGELLDRQASELLAGHE